jgi:SAM-dependent methyltransferase
VILPNLLRLIDVKKGDRILDIACGQGFFSRALAEKGGEVTGVDLAPELIDFAKKHQGSTLIKYYVASADNLGKNIVDKSFDKAVVVLAIQNIENLSGSLTEASRALKVGGKLFLVLNHPAFRNPKHTAWDFDEKNKMQYRRVEEYLSESRTEIDMNPGMMSTGSSSLHLARANHSESSHHRLTTTSFHRPLQAYFKALNKAGFMVGRLEEWNSNKKSGLGPRQQAEDKARKEIPLFLMLEAIKMK